MLIEGKRSQQQMKAKGKRERNHVLVCLLYYLLSSLYVTGYQEAGLLHIVSDLPPPPQFFTQ